MSETWQGWQRLSMAIGPGLAGWAIRAAVLLAAVWAVTSLIPRRSAGLRNACWLGALLVLPLLPVAGRLMPVGIFELPAPRAMPVARTASPAPPASLALSPEVPLAVVDAAPAAPAAAEGPAGIAWGRTVAAALMAVWAAGALVMMVRLAVSSRWVKGLCRDSTEVRDHAWLDVAAEARRALSLPRPVDVRASGAIAMPATVGLIWPVVLMPRDLLDSGRGDLVEHAIYHEMAHVKRWDSVVTLYRRLLAAVLFFHPLVWLAGRRYVLEQEHLCDDWAVSALRDRHAYARALTEMAELVVHGRGAPVLSFAHRPSAIRRRVTRVLEDRQMDHPRLGAWGKAAVVVVCLALLGVTGSVTLGPAPVAAAEQEDAAEAVAAAIVPEVKTLQHDDGTMEQKYSLGASGHWVQFECPAGQWHLTELQIYGARYGSTQPPDDSFTISLCNETFETVKSIKKPYSIFARRGEWRGYSVPVPPLELPRAAVEGGLVTSAPFWINVAFNPSKTKGIYLGADESGFESFSKIGLPDQQPRETPEPYNWIVRLVITNTPPEEVDPRLGEWRAPALPLVDWRDAGLIEISNDDGASDGK